MAKLMVLVFICVVYNKYLSSACKDTHIYCGDWSSNGECQKNSGYMLEACPNSCHQCKNICICMYNIPRINLDDFSF